MNKGAIRDFAMRARKRLMEETERKIGQLKIDGKGEMDKLEEIGGHYRLEGFGRDGFLDAKAMDARKTLAGLIAKKGLTQVVEEVSYTWFNRFIAIRFMEVNAYLPMSVRVLSSNEAGRREPEALERIYAFYDEFGLDKETVFKLKEGHRDEELFRLILLSTCKRLGEIMPEIFEEILDYTELLLPDLLLAPASILSDLVESIEEEDFTDQVEIIGWLYQFYIKERHDEVFKKKKFAKEDIPAATQLFTPDWIVKYMLENSLGKLWQDSHPDEEMKSEWSYYIDEPKQDDEVARKLEQLNYTNVSPEDIKVLDPSMGSGHILVYAFDLLYEMYLSKGYDERQIPYLILEKNLYGLELDERATQLACFSLFMKARSKNRRFFRKPFKHNLCTVKPSNGIDREILNYMFEPENTEIEKTIHREQLAYLLDVFTDADIYGSLIKVDSIDFDGLEKRVDDIAKQGAGWLFLQGYKNMIIENLPGLIKQGRILSEKYDVVCTNPPYMGRKKMVPKLVEYLDGNFKDSKGDLFAVFMEVSMNLTKRKSYMAMINQQSWMFLSSYEKLRVNLICGTEIQSMIHLGPRAFEEIDGEVVQSTTFVIRKISVEGYKGVYIRVEDEKNPKQKNALSLDAIRNPSVSYRYTTSIKDFSKIPGSPIAYWASEKIFHIYEHNKILRDFGKPKIGQNTGDNKRFLRLWFEISVNKITFGLDNDELKVEEYKWIPYNKGGAYRKWYGNQDYVINWELDGKQIKDYAVIRNNGKHWSRYIQNIKYMCKEGITWTFISSSKFATRYLPKGFICDVAGSAIYLEKENYYWVLGLINTNMTFEFMKMQNPTLNFQAGNVANIPVLVDFKNEKIVEDIVKDCISISKTDWDSFENSWDFKTHPFITHRNETNTIEQAFNNWSAFAENQFYKLKANEEELNRIFIDIYGLQDELAPDVEEKDVTVSKADRERDVKSFISYAVGCMFGRYSLDKEGLAFAGGEFDLGSYQTFIPLKDNVLLLLEEDYGLNDATELFAGFLETVFGRDSLPDNLRFVADSLNPKNHESPKETIRRYFLKDFYKDHCQIYKKRPIYWMADSGRKDGFKALFYLHRYDRNLLARIRTDYLHATQSAYEGQTGLMEQAGSIDAKDRKKLDAYRKKLEEVGTFDKVAGHLANKRIELDLDDGVEVNYAKFMNIEIPQGVGKKPLKMNFLGKRK